MQPTETLPDPKKFLVETKNIFNIFSEVKYHKILQNI